MVSKYLHWACEAGLAPVIMLLIVISIDMKYGFYIIMAGRSDIQRTSSLKTWYLPELADSDLQAAFLLTGNPAH